MEKIKFRRDRDKTLLQNVANLKASGDWFLSNYFWFLIKAIVNGKPWGRMEGKPTGDNFGYCKVCGTSIIHHYTIKDKKTKTEFNVGCECIHRFIDEKKATSIKKGINSLRNKTKSDFLRSFKHDALVNWLKENAEESDKIRNPKHFEFLKELWLDSVSCGSRSMEEDIEGKEWNIYGNPLTIYSYDSLNKIWDDGNINRIWGQGSKNYWSYHSSIFPNKDWNPDNMRKEYNIEADRYETKKIPIWTKLFILTEEQETELNDLITKKVNEYVDELKARQGIVGV